MLVCETQIADFISLVLCAQEEKGGGKTAPSSLLTVLGELPSS